MMLKKSIVFDMVIQDYKMAETNALISLDEYSSLKDKAKTLEMEKRQLEVECENIRLALLISSPAIMSHRQYRTGQKINALEKFLWSNGFNPNTIK